MKYLAISLLFIFSFNLTAQQQSIEQLQQAVENSQGAAFVENSLKLARAFYENENYQQAGETASKVIGEAAALGLSGPMQEAQKMTIQCEQIVALENSRAKSEGIGAVAVTIQLSDFFFKNGEFEKAERLAAEAYAEAERLDNKSFMATALNKEAKAAMKKENAGKEEKAEARKKFKKSLRLLTENKVIDPILKKENIDNLEDFGQTIVSAVELEEAREAVKMAMDSINRNLDRWSVGEVKLEMPKKPQTTGHPAAGEHPEKQNPRYEKRRELFEKILDLNRERMARELVEPLPPPAADAAAAEVWVQHVTDEMKDLWPAQVKVIETDLTENQKRIEKMAPEEMREELLLATYKNRYDSLMHLHLLDSINLEKQEMAIRQHEAEMERQKARRSFLMTGSGSTLLLAIFLFVGFTRQKKSNRLLSQKNEEIRHEQQRSEELLLNILPAQVAGELKKYGEAKARQYENVTVLFSDFKNFTGIAENLPPEKLVKELDFCFKAFDEIVSRHGLEKIKTIGDAYMCAGGLTSQDGNHAAQSVKAALEMQQFLDACKAQKMAHGEPYFEARIGIHTGPVVAGVVGKNKFAYDIWGDTVNIASRMEAGSEPGRINISGGTKQLVGDAFRCTYRGKIEAKNKGEIDMYFVEGVG